MQGACQRLFSCAKLAGFGAQNSACHAVLQGAAVVGGVVKSGQAGASSAGSEKKFGRVFKNVS